MYAHGKVAATLDLIHVWRFRAGTWTSLYCVVSPGRLSGTYIVISEDTANSSWHAKIRVAGAHSDLTIDDGRLDESILGSEFTYADLQIAPAYICHDPRVCLPDPYEHSLNAWIHASIQRGVEQSHVRIRVNRDGIVTAAECLDADGGTRRTRTVEEVGVFSGYNIETRIRAVAPGPFSSVLSLKSIHLRAAYCEWLDSFESRADSTDDLNLIQRLGDVL